TSLRPSPKRPTLRLRRSSQALFSHRMDLRTRQPLALSRRAPIPSAASAEAAERRLDAWHAKTLAEEDPERFHRAGARWHARFVLEAKGSLTLMEELKLGARLVAGYAKRSRSPTWSGR